MISPATTPSGRKSPRNLEVLGKDCATHILFMGLYPLHHFKYAPGLFIATWESGNNQEKLLLRNSENYYNLNGGCTLLDVPSTPDIISKIGYVF